MRELADSLFVGNELEESLYQLKQESFNFQSMKKNVFLINYFLVIYRMVVLINAEADLTILYACIKLLPRHRRLSFIVEDNRRESN